MVNSGWCQGMELGEGRKLLQLSSFSPGTCITFIIFKKEKKDK